LRKDCSQGAQDSILGNLTGHTGQLPTISCDGQKLRPPGILAGALFPVRLPDLAGKAVKGKNQRGLSRCARFGGGIAAVHPEAFRSWLCVQHEEDGANACTCADESI
jgi:hypothetical protein